MTVQSISAVTLAVRDMAPGPSDERDERVKDLQAKIGELTMDNELLQQRIDRLEARRPLAHRRSRK
jgi:hypothetical protein